MSNENSLDQRMALRAALKVLADLRHDEWIVVTHQGSARVWPLVEQHPLDFHYNPSTMGGAVPLGLGLALARPSREVVVITGDGALLMNLGSLVSVMAAGVKNLSVVVLDNGVYDVTGGQKHPASSAPLRYEDAARSIGFPTVFRFDSEKSWRNDARHVFSGAGPRFITLLANSAEPGDLKSKAVPINAQVNQLIDNLR